jgi:lipopolysaccharide transport system permease protein
MAGSILTDIGATFYKFHTWRLMGGRDIAMRYRRSVLGPFWISIASAMTVLGIGLLYSEVFGQKDVAGYIRFVAAGFLAWWLIAQLVTESTQVVLESDSMLRSVRLPVPVLSARTVWRNLIIFAHNFAVLGGLILILGGKVGLVTLLLIPGVALTLLFGYLLGIALGPLCARFRDIPQIVQNIMQLMIFLTPVFWAPEAVKNKPFLKDGNPLYHLVEVIRGPALGYAPTELNWIVVISMVAMSIALALLSLSVSRDRVYLWI